MTKGELIVKQQLEIEELKNQISAYKEACDDVSQYLCRPEQWSIKCPDFPKVAMSGIVRAMQVVRDI